MGREGSKYVAGVGGVRGRRAQEQMEATGGVFTQNIEATAFLTVH